MTLRNFIKKYGRRKAGTWGRTHGPTRGNTKRTANKAMRAFVRAMTYNFRTGGKA